MLLRHNINRIAIVILLISTSIVLFACQEGSADKEQSSTSSVKQQTSVSDSTTKTPIVNDSQSDKTPKTSIDTKKDDGKSVQGAQVKPTPIPTTKSVSDDSSADKSQSESSTSEEYTTINEYGYELNLFGEVLVDITGISSDDASKTEGRLSFPYSGANVALLWLPMDDLTTPDFLSTTYGILKTSQPDFQFNPKNQGELPAVGAWGIYGTFTASKNNQIVGGGLIGSWACREDNTIFSITVTGLDVTTVQIRFNELVTSFDCVSPLDK